MTMSPEEALRTGQELFEHTLKAVAGTEDETVGAIFFIPRKDDPGLILIPAPTTESLSDWDPQVAKRHHVALARSVADAEGAEWVGHVSEGWINPEHTADAAFVEVQLRSGLTIAMMRGFSKGRRRRLVGAWELVKSLPYSTAVFKLAVTEVDKTRLRDELRRLNPGISGQQINALIAERTTPASEA